MLKKFHSFVALTRTEAGAEFRLQPGQLLGRWLTLAVLGVGLTACRHMSVKSEAVRSSATAPGFQVTHVDPAGAAELIASDSYRLVDVRTPEEFAAGHLEGATNINIGATDFRQKLAGLDRGSPLLVYCRSGNRSTQSLRVFEELGYEGVTHLDGGFKAWQREVEREGK